MQLGPDDMDPWRDTDQGRAPERDNPLDGAGSGTLGASPETIGVPNVTGGVSPSRPSGGDAPRMPRAAVVAVVALLLLVVVLSAIAWLA